ncbi:hypothetical protein TNCV_2068271 [Trichonephila clavipes]|uniref:Uncharacterized protein n=1 Tax=Trichonephila clavipes TaxID=2585209 RepID=A0A8X6W3P5_TRICX|nr:hypothetical protein TNCV_2068271 [Trichonephila clavipes]
MYCLKAQTNNRTNIEVTEVIAVKVLKHLSSHQKGMHIIGADPDSLDLPNYRGQPGFEKNPSTIEMLCQATMSNKMKE